MIQQRQGVSFKIIVSLIRIRAFTVKLFRSRHKISWAFFLITLQLLMPPIVFNWSGYYLYLQDFCLARLSVVPYSQMSRCYQ